MKYAHVMTSSHEPTANRRDFLTQLAAGASAIWGSGCSAGAASGATHVENGESKVNPNTSASTEPPKTVTPKTTLGVALLGLGSYASERLAPGLQLTQHCKLVGLITGTPSKI